MDICFKNIWAKSEFRFCRNRKHLDLMQGRAKKAKSYIGNTSGILSEDISEEGVRKKDVIETTSVWKEVERLQTVRDASNVI